MSTPEQRAASRITGTRLRDATLLLVLSAVVIALAGISLVALIWNEQRSWTTRAGRAALRAWEAAHPSPAERERALVEAITGMDTIDLRPPDRSPLHPDARKLAASLAL